MVVNSLNFFLFFVIVFLVYYFLLKDNGKMQNRWLLLCSYVFYGIAAWKMIPLLLIATILFYIIGIGIGKYNRINEKKASWLTTVGTLLGIGLLLYFKYLNFFIESFSSFFNAIGFSVNFPTFDILMPLGISFFTFKLISYIIEVHRERMEPCTDFVSFSLYVSFFPTILAGPIDRPQAFLVQLKHKREFDYTLAVEGCRQIIWGMFKKMLIADNIALFVNTIWSDIPNANTLTLIMAALLFPIQIYADFSGYSDMAIGTGKLLGIRIARNFNVPFFARNIAEYWRNWHISLTSWLTDYVFMPLNIYFRNMGNYGSISAIIITFILIGLWHGANSTFAVFGLYHGVLYIPLIFSGIFLKKKKLIANPYGLPYLNDLLKMFLTFLLVVIGLLIFKAENIDQLQEYVSALFTNTDINSGRINHVTKYVYVFIVLMFCLEWKYKAQEFPFQKMKNGRLFGLSFCRFFFYFLMILLIIFFQGDNTGFIYSRF